jgi:hypothetical protein
MKAQPLLLPALKRRRGPRVAVLALVLCSLLVPLAFLFDRAPSGTSTVYPTLSRSLPLIPHWVGSAGPAALGSPRLRRLDLGLQLFRRLAGYRAHVLINQPPASRLFGTGFCWLTF